MNIFSSKKIRITAFFIMALLILSVPVFILNKKNKKFEGFEIQFPQIAGPVPQEKLLKESNILEMQDNLQRAVASEEAYIYKNPQLTDYSIVTALGFDINNYTFFGSDSNDRFYRDPNNYNKTLRIDQFGCFSYRSGISTTNFEMPYTDKECLEIAKKYLKEYNLFSTKIGYWGISQTGLYSESNGEIISAKTVNLLPKEVDGLSVSGNSRISVEINGNGEVCNVTYNLREYEAKLKVNLISFGDAVSRIETGKAFFQVENTSTRFIFDNVVLAYYTQDRDPDNLIMQPVYIFKGTSYTTSGESEPFAITVQANRVK